ncbi:tetratricopeptide repeat protein [Flavobacteriales bacterium]|nr:tetratricopeptide repeat protein [Flavobacteriales bacterium]
MRKLISLVAIFLLLFNVQAQSEWEIANKAYTESEYELAIKSYESILEKGEGSFEVYYNSANAYYRLNRYADAVLNYEKALLFDPGNEDAVFNLELANSFIKDKVELNNKFDTIRIMNHLSKFISPYSIQLFSIGLIVFLLVLIVWMKYKSRKLRLLWLVLCIVFSFSLFSLSKWIDRESSKYTEGVVFSPRVSVKSSPIKSGTKLFILHEGTKVRVLNEENNWLRIYLDEDKMGWIESSSIEKITF